MVHGRLSLMLGARLSSTPLHHQCEGRPPAFQASRATRATNSAVASAACLEGPRGARYPICGCSGHPAFPAPSEFEGRMLLGKNSRGCAARSRSCVRKGCYLTIESVTVIPRHRHSGFDASHRPGMTNVEVFPSLRANGSRECAPDDKLREAIQLSARNPALGETSVDCF